MEASELVISAIKSMGKPSKTSEIAEITDMNKKEVEKIIKKLTIEGKVFSPVRCFYDLKK